MLVQFKGEEPKITENLKVHKAGFERCRHAFIIIIFLCTALWPAKCRVLAGKEKDGALKGVCGCIVASVYIN